MNRCASVQCVGLLLVSLFFSSPSFSAEEIAVGEKIQLSPPTEKSTVSIEEALWQRHSVRAFSSRVPEWDRIGQLLWAGQGINRSGSNKRTAPSAGGLYPLTLYVVLPDGVYRYLPEEHAVVKTMTVDADQPDSDAGLKPFRIYDAPCVFVVCAEFEKTKARFTDQAPRYIYEEAGHVAQNILLQAVSLGMGGVPAGSVIGSEEQKAIEIPKEQEVVYLIATGFEKKAE